MTNSLENLLRIIDDERAGLAEYEIAKKIEQYFDGDQNDQNFVSELIAFNLAPDYENKKGTWGFYYGPKFVLANEDGSTSESPSFSNIDRKSTRLNSSHVA